MSHQKFQSCITACYECAAECDHCATACLGEDNVKMMHKCIEIDLYCADMCRTAATFMARADEH
ncbi:MAG: four-helix bundle copper-binding protein, partial [Sphingobacteriales bacterium]